MAGIRWAAVPALSQGFVATSRRWGPGLLAAAAVEAAAGLLGAALANLVGVARSPVVFFVGTAMVVLADMALVPGWVWARSRFAPLVLLARLAFGIGAVHLAAMGALVMGMAAASLPYPFGAVPDWVGFVVFALMVIVGGGVAGLGAAAAQRMDWRPPTDQPPRAGFRAHLYGGAAGILPLAALAWGAGVNRPIDPALARQWWALLAVLPATLIITGLPHNILVLRDAARDQPASISAIMARRAAICVALLTVAASAMALLASQDTQPSPTFVSPGGHYAALLVSDTAFGQVETLLVVAQPGTAEAHMIFAQPGDTPLTFLRWRDEVTAELEMPGPAGHAGRLILACQPERCTLGSPP